MLLHKTKSYAVITGASSGIGAEFAKRLAYHGYNCILVARREDRLKALCEELNNDTFVDGDVSYICADLQTMPGCERLIKEISSKRIEVFINNAGFGDCNEFINGDINKELQMIDLNVKSVHYLTKAMLKLMEKKAYGFILNTASSAGLMPGGPYMATYYATKSYVVSLTRAIAQELKEANSSIYVGALCPGPVDTEFNSVAGVSFALPGITAEKCVDEAMKGMFSKKTIIVPSFTMKVATIFSRFIPQSLVVKITSAQQQKKM